MNPWQLSENLLNFLMIGQFVPIKPLHHGWEIIIMITLSKDACLGSFEIIVIKKHFFVCLLRRRQWPN